LKVGETKVGKVPGVGNVVLEKVGGGNLQYGKKVGGYIIARKRNTTQGPISTRLVTIGELSVKN